MGAFAQMWDTARRQLFAVVPKEYEKGFKEEAFKINIVRFTAQSFVLVVMDSCVLIICSLFLRNTIQNSGPQCGVLLFKLAVMAACFFLFTYIGNKGYNARSILCRNWDVIYPTLHLLLETLLFITSPQGLGALIRFIAVPFIVGSIPTMKQSRSFTILLGAYIFGAYYLQNHTAYSSYANVYGFFVNYWIVVFVCAVLISFTVYSWSVNVFLAREKEKRAREQLSELNTSLKKASRHDMLTGILNRRGFQHRMDSEWAAHKRGAASSVSALMFDIDYFKKYNDRYGHTLGDECLCKVTDVINKHLSDFCIVSRYGGEEFVAICFGVDHDKVVSLAEQVRLDIESQKIENPDSDISPYITICAGVTTQYTVSVGSYDNLIEYADQNLYHAKGNGRNQVIHTRFTRDEYMDSTGSALSFERYADMISETIDEDYMQRVLQDISADCTFIYDSNTRKLEFSRSAVELYGVPHSIMNPTIESIPDYLKIADSDTDYFYRELNRALNVNEPFLQLSLHISMRNRSSVLVAVRAQCSYNKDGSIDILYGSVFSAQKLMEYNHYMREHSKTNSITLLPNRQQLNADLKALLKNSKDSGYLVLIDINNFKEINSTFSHNIGDKVLYETSRHLSKLTASRSIPVYSYNVDQFVLIMNNSTEEDTRYVMHDISQYFHSDFQLIEGLDLQVDFTMLAVEFDCYTTILDDLYVDLDIAIQYAKYEKPSSFFFLTEEIRNMFLAKVGLSNSLKRAVENDFDGFMLYYQPIFNGDGTSCLGAEALLRWKDADGNVVAPNIIIPELEKASLMNKVEKWVFNAACRQCSEWISQGAGNDFFMHINLSPASIGRPTLVDDVSKAIADNHLDLKNVVFEAIETSAIFEMKTAVHSLASLQNNGIRIAIDDFGTGYSSLSYLSSLPADEIKIDRYFLNNIDRNPSNRDFLSSIIGLAKSMGFLVCLEGVETAGQYKAIRELINVDYLQGFYFGKPMPAAIFYKDFLSKDKFDMRYFQSALTSQ